MNDRFMAIYSKEGLMLLIVIALLCFSFKFFLEWWGNRCIVISKKTNKIMTIISCVIFVLGFVFFLVAPVIFMQK